MKMTAARLKTLSVSIQMGIIPVYVQRAIQEPEMYSAKVSGIFGLQYSFKVDKL